MSKESIEVSFSKITPISESKYAGFENSKEILKIGTTYRHGGPAIPCDILCERDVAVTLRDGTVIYTDIFRPVDGKDIPALVVWSPYGKRAHWLNYDMFENRMGIPEAWEDGLNEFEGPNPSYWVNHGYAILHPDPRGIFSSEGDLHAWGTQEAEDEYDFIEWTAKQEWSNGKIGLTGNSWLAMAQWNVAAHNPPHLAAIAPWEGALDNYRETSCKGGIPDIPFVSGIFTHLYGNNNYEDLPKMIEMYPFINEYWEDKIAKVEQIKVPAYVVASYTNALHTRGTFEAWNKIASEEKWLRIHNTHEWYDYYTPEHVEDLRKFFDHYLKLEENGWEETSEVRLTVLDPGHKDIVNRPEESFPLQRQQLKKLYLDASTSMLTSKEIAQEAHIEYMPNDGASFTLTFEQDTEIVGYMNLRLWVAAESAYDMDIFAYVRKRDNQGNLVPIPVINNQFYEGGSGRLRVSMRQLDEKNSRLEKPSYTFTKEEKLQPGEIVPVEIEFWPMGMKWHAGEHLEVFINGTELLKHPEFPNMPPVETINKGKHAIYTGGKYDSYLVVPVIPSL